MLADYVMKSIDNLFSDKLKSQSIMMSRNGSILQNQIKPAFSKATIKQSLHTIIRRDHSDATSPLARKDGSPSPISKSRLKIILEHNKNQKIRSVVKRSMNHREETSPYKKIEVSGSLMEGPRKINQTQFINSDLSNKQNNIIRYYRQERKSMQKSRLMDKSIQKEAKRSRIFIKSTQLSHNASKCELQYSRN